MGGEGTKIQNAHFLSEGIMLDVLIGKTLKESLLQ